MKKFSELVVGDTLNVYSKDTENFVTVLSKKKIIDIIKSALDMVIFVKGGSGYIVNGDESIKLFSGENSNKDIILSAEELSNVPWPK